MSFKARLGILWKKILTQQLLHGSRTSFLCGTQLIWGGWERGIRVFSATFILIHNEALNAFVKVPPAFAVTLLFVLSCKTEGDQGSSTALLYYLCLQ